MYMIAHEHPAMYLNLKSAGPLAQPMSIGSNIGVAGEKRLTIIATLNDVNRNSDWQYLRRLGMPPST